jgi:hypothetical protein
MLITWKEAMLVHKIRRHKRTELIFEALDRLPPETRSEKLRAALEKVKSERERIYARTPKIIQIEFLRSSRKLKSKQLKESVREEGIKSDTCVGFPQTRGS